MKEEILNGLGIQGHDADSYSPLVLAYLGDSFYELVIRTSMVGKANAPVNVLNKKGSNLAKASTQSSMINGLLPILTDDETAVYKRGRNAKSYTSAKNASINDYRRATGFEALLGWLYLKGDTKRALSLIKKGFELEGYLQSKEEL